MDKAWSLARIITDRVSKILLWIFPFFSLKRFFLSFVKYLRVYTSQNSASLVVLEMDKNIAFLL